ncbi:hypothetical protein P154DRAFT_533765 [Amniculicola lignicola CBS 123094]|uniref:Uncharacterized protein n=1 Tax=Amniculicola lignicola CBS 123094 TaxID=1392246 RepID=A0A6A5WIQ7_9PLEO|nr:hypothetical protein P154DRAFT_533765 [Amniculicola lignicola CBS 123094]
MSPKTELVASSATGVDASYVYYLIETCGFLPSQEQSFDPSSNPEPARNDDYSGLSTTIVDDQKELPGQCHDALTHVHTALRSGRLGGGNRDHAAMDSRPPTHRHTNTPPGNSRTLALRLSEGALALHNAILVYKLSMDEALLPARIGAVQEAARKMGFDLPEEALTGEKWCLDEWVSEQRSARFF